MSSQANRSELSFINSVRRCMGLREIYPEPFREGERLIFRFHAKREPVVFVKYGTKKRLILRSDSGAFFTTYREQVERLKEL